MLKFRDDSQSEIFSQPLRRMDCRVKPGNDEGKNGNDEVSS